MQYNFPLCKRGIEGDFRVLHYRKDLTSKARELRTAMTDAEQLLWFRLRRKQIEGIQFYRQKPVAGFIVDFHAPRCGLVVEVDGSQHLTATGQLHDEKRTAALNRMGLKVLRFDNLQVLKETEAVLEVIHNEVVAALSSALKSPPAPLLQRGESSDCESTKQKVPFAKGGGAKRGGFQRGQGPT